MKEVKSTSYFYLDSCNIHGGLNLSKVNFQHILSIKESSINSNESFKRHTYIDDCIFNNIVNFDNTIIHKAFVFVNSKINSKVSFLSTIFDCDLSTPVFASVHIGNNNISTQGALQFIGDENVKIFSQSHDVVFAENTLLGELRFENCNLQKIDVSYRQYLLDESKNIHSGIHIGSGCIKYRVQTRPISIGSNSVDGNIIRELSTSFTNYFISSNGFNLGVEFENKTINNLKLFYYTDENISLEELYERLQITENRYWEFSIPENTVVSQEQMTNVIDNYVSKLSVFSKIKFRVIHGLWGENYVKETLEAISFSEATRDMKSINVYVGKMKMINGINIEKQKNIGGSHQFADEIINNP